MAATPPPPPPPSATGIRHGGINLHNNNNDNDHNDDIDDDDDHHHYIDYSCSTSIERLARDLETIMYAWHVDHSDRHVVAQVATTTTDSTTPMLLLLRSQVLVWNLSFSYSSSGSGGSSGSSSSSGGGHNNNVQQRRRRRQRGVHHPVNKVTCDLELRLDLWNGPPPSPTTTNIHDDDDDDPPDENEDGGVLPHSLQRRQQQHYSRISSTSDDDDDDDDWFGNFSTLFGIGQHLTLTPVHPDCFFVASTTTPTMDDDEIDHHHHHHDTTNASMAPSLASVPPITGNTTTTTTTNPLYQPLLQYLTDVILLLQQHQNHAPDPTTTTTTASMILSTWLQTALNLAVGHCDCQIPVFGMWGHYHGGGNNNNHRTGPRCHSDSRIMIPFDGDDYYCYEIPLVPSQDIVAPYPKPSSSSSSSWPHVVRRFSPKHWISGHVWSSMSSTTTSFSVWTIPQPTPSSSSSYFQWHIWGDILHQQLIMAVGASESTSPGSSSSSSALVHLCRAKHTYVWKKPRPLILTGGAMVWQALKSSTIPDAPTFHHRQQLMIREWRAQNVWMEPPPVEIDDPAVAESMQEYIYLCQQYITQLIEQALGRHDDDDEPVWGPNDDPIDSMTVQLEWSSPPTHPLLTLPLHSRHDMSATDWDEMVDATESAILDPYRAQTSRLSVVYDSDVAPATLATTQRCILAALIRSATLPRETLVSQLYDTHTIRLWDNQAGNRLAVLMCKKSNVDPATRSLVDAMDWQHASVEMIERYEAETIVRGVFNGKAAYGYPSPPDNIVSVLAGDFDGATTGDGDSTHRTWNGWKPLRQSAPPGRLLSLLFLQMGRVRSPSSMALVWSVFVEELRRRLDSRESLPNMNYIPGFDPPVVEPSEVDSTSASKRSCFRSVGTKAHFAALVNSTEPDPDDMHCLIGQKLQVFNLCLESMISSDLRQVEMFENRSPDDMEFDTTEQHEPKKQSPSPPKTLLNGSVVDGLPFVDNTVTMNEEPDRDDSSKSTITQEFYDAMDSDLFASPNKAGKRMGARCPIQGMYLNDSGDQMYAPYLQRPYPLTDDVIAERLLILSRQNKESGTATMQQRLDIVHHFQKPKLLSDMRSFKGANPGATFDDFTKWYGSPGDSLSLIGKLLSTEGADENDCHVLGKNWIQALDVSREFWMNAWADVKAVAACDQEPLFDAESTVEVALDFLENVHPAAFMGQVVAVNLAMSYFILNTSKGETIRIPFVRDKIDRLHSIIEEALQQLSLDATKLIDNVAFQNNDPNVKMPESTMYAKSISTCTRACEMIAATEFVLSRARSLLHKLPKQYDLVQKLLVKFDNHTVPINDESSLCEILHTITTQQQLFLTTSSAKPILRQYMLRNVDDAIPCQLCVRTYDEGAKVLDTKEQLCTVLAMTRTIRDTD